MEQCHASLKRLGVDYIDLYQCHRFDTSTPVDETWRAIETVSDSPPGQDSVRGDQRVDGPTNRFCGKLCPGTKHRPDCLQSAPVQYSLPHDREGSYSALCARGNRPGRLLAACPGRAGRPISARPSASQDSRAASEAANVIQRLMREDVLEAVERLRPIAADLKLSLKPAFPGLGASPAELKFGDHRRVTAGAD